MGNPPPCLYQTCLHCAAFYRKFQGIPSVSLIIILIEFCERFAYYGMSTQLLLYFETKLQMSDNAAASHVLLFTSGAYFTPGGASFCP